MVQGAVLEIVLRRQATLIMVGFEGAVGMLSLLSVYQMEHNQIINY